ncbi:MAG: Uma2 family endonuclease [Labilithrix sp.]|nr:Uma2 family endonuclease [Labilithrix sp.]
MVAAASLEVTCPPAEQRMLLQNVSWKQYVLLRDLLDGPGVRLTYVKGVLEVLSPSPEHELWKKNIARLVELFAHVRRIDLYGYGSTTFRKEARERGAEPDECYLVGKKLADYPEIVLEVVHTTPLIDKLDVYAAFGVLEVWVFKNGAFSIYGFDAATSTYRARSGSALLEGLDFELVARLAVREDTPQALRELEQALGAPTTPSARGV